ncbi:MAG TPA: nucleotide exchange factor GrpE [Ktedonobacterales bacterium]|jgi:molecular chaperone GrpE|nr:nucleotide exchange factor GrpE [Ktedonobacterales bacterium]
MSEEERTTQAGEADVVPDAGETPTAKMRAMPGDDAEATASETADSEGTSELSIAELEQQLAKEREAATDYMQRWQRAQADFANFRRRLQQEQEQRDRQLVAEALSPVLLALDSFERAFRTLPQSLRQFSWIDGIALIELQLRRTLDIYGIQPIAAQPGQPFDATKHQAIGEIETDKHPDGTIAEVIQQGYQHATGNMILRPTLVQVAKAPNSESAADAANATEVGEETPPEPSNATD